MYLLAPFILQRGNPQAKNDTFVLNNFFWYKPLLLLSSTYWPSSLCKILKKSYRRFRFMGVHHFWAQNGPFELPKIFLENDQYQSHLLVSPFHGAKFYKKFFQQIQSYEDVQFLDPKWPISSNENFFRKPVNEPCFFYLCLSTCQKSKSN